ncbi:MAG: hypothetical protein AUI16_00420 [Alphaproteobacteria bacterium 13_2_20CM_2_64_7]|nr:MAG: hypothetical protein AUI16_00420 [Alphaproteobacteria bacterium 13_2_20CM_2_64_7]
MTNPRLEAALALHRFGFGPVVGSIAAIAGDPRGAVLADLERPGAGRVAAANLPNSGQAARALFEFRAERLAKEKLAQRAKKEAEAKGMLVGTADGDAMNPNGDAQAPKPEAAQTQQNQQPPLMAQLVQNEAKVRIEAAVAAEIGFVEHLVWFWSNHFCVSANKIVSMAGAYEREAIRPHVLGRFVDMLTAVESHPAMLFYLDNLGSMGPNSVAGINRDKSLNENLAREILELHTLGVRTGYSQDDVTHFANVLTGWTWIGLGEPNRGGEFVFVKRLHEPGEQTVMGKTYPDTGMDQGRAVLADLARHPATAAHIAHKFARHFVADEPPPSLVDKLTKSFNDSDGNLKELAKTLLAAEESWTPERTKLKRPFEWLISALRLTGAPWVVGRVMAGQALLGEPLWRPPAPNGFADYESAWIDGLSQRVDIANNFAGRVAERLDPVALVEAGLGPLASAETRNTVAGAESRAQALTLLLMAPEFLRR